MTPLPDEAPRVRWPGVPALLRYEFDRGARFAGAFGVIAVLAALAALPVVWMDHILGDACRDLPVSIGRLEVAFSAARLSALLHAEGKACMAPVVRTFGPDFLFAVLYALLLAALYTWAERWRRSAPDGAPAGAPRRRGDVFIRAALLAGAFDLVENAFLLSAMHAITADASATPHARVAIGSTASAIKWALLLAVAYGLCAELLAGPRGRVLRRLRFSALAVALGAVPLLALAQGQDLLQRLVEGDHRTVRVAAGVLAIAFGATAIWYCGRKLLQVAPVDAGESAEWRDFFAQELPRILGLAAIASGGAAFARAGLGLGWFAGAAVLGLVVVLALGALDRRLGWRLPVLRLRALQTAAATLGGIAVLAVGWRVTSVRHSGRFFGPREIAHLWVAAGACLALGWLLYLVVYYRRAFVAARGGDVDAHAIREQVLGREHGVPRAPASALGRTGFVTLVVGLAASALFLLLFTRDAVRTARFLGPLWVLTLAETNAVLLGSVAAWIGVRYRIPVVRLGLALGLACSFCNDNHLVPGIAGSTARVDARPRVDAHYRAWLDARAAVGIPRTAPVVVVAAQGGGLRAAYWAAVALAALQDSTPTFVRHVYAISGVSGGSLGGAVFASLVRDAEARAGGADSLPCAVHAVASAADEANGGTPRRVAYTACARRFMRDDFLSPVLAKLVAPDFVQQFLPFPVAAFDRSRALEGSWDASYQAATTQPTFERPFLDLVPTARDSRAGAPIPALLMNATHVESGRRYVTAPMPFDRVVHDAGDVLRITGADLPLVAAVHNSARFTLVSPAGRLQRRPLADSGQAADSGHVVDGGYFENSGLATVRELRDSLLAMRAGAPDTSRVAGPPVLVLYLCNDPVGCGRDVEAETTGAVNRQRAAGELLAPVFALLHTREARGSLARAQLYDRLGGAFVQLNVCDDALVLAKDTSKAVAATKETSELGRERVISPPLGWSLSQLARDWMDSSLGLTVRGTVPETSACRARNAGEIDRLLRYLRDPTGALAAEAIQRAAAVAESRGTKTP